MIVRTEARSVGRTRKPIRVGLSCISAEISGMELILPYVADKEEAPNSALLAPHSA
jgi:hypothetical protein